LRWACQPDLACGSIDRYIVVSIREHAWAYVSIYLCDELANVLPVGDRYIESGMRRIHSSRRKTHISVRQIYRSMRQI
jgi:hypothetical protein